MREKGADIGVLVTEVLPKELERMGLIDGVWICTYEEFKGLSSVLRESIIKINQAKKSEENGKLIARANIYFLKATNFTPKIKPSKGSAMRTFEMRIYTAMPEKLQNLEERFRDHTMKIFKNNGMQNIAYFTTIEKNPADQAKLLYFLAYENEEAGKLAWQNFRKDPEWIKASTASEVNGKLVEKVESVYMKPLDFSKLK